MGRDERFERDVLCHVGAAYNLARWLLGNDHDAEDAVQEGMLKALRAFGSHADAKSWFLAIVRNTCLNVLRSRSRRANFETEDEVAMMSARETAPRPDDLVEQAFDADRLRRAIEELPPAWKEVIILREFEQMTYLELSEVTAVPIGTVMSRLSRARDRLHELLCEEER